jgi:hypothetical protein
MVPWLWVWAPQVHYPWSGAVAQHIEPKTTWFVDHVAPSAGNAAIEEQAVAVASYGRQLGLLTEVVIGLTERVAPNTPEAAEALARLREIRARIEAIKADAAQG